MTRNSRRTGGHPVLDLRLGGIRLTVQLLPYPVLAFLGGIAGSLGTTLWLTR